jgi:methylmalonyl-CoA mutase
MTEETPGTELLHLADDFPPVATAEWEAAIQKDLKGADYQKLLVWRTDEGIAVKPYYRREDVAGLDYRNTVPGQFPFVRAQRGSWEIAQEKAPAEDAIRADRLHEAGATAVQELGYALANAVERLSNSIDRGTSLEQAAREVEFVFSIGSNFFFEIAKLRAMRVLWAQALSACGSAGVPAPIHARTSRLNKSVLDPYMNLLRATTEAMSAVIGGCESLDVEAAGFDPHLALNVHRILADEAHLADVADAAGGSYYVEALTDALAREAWKLFQKVEAEGGWSKALASGSVEKAIRESGAAKQKAVSLRRKTLVGVNNDPNLKEKSAAAALPSPEQSPSPVFRLAEAFERIRERTARHAKETGRFPVVLLLKRGDVKMRGARANFCLNFFGCAGFDVQDSDTLEGAAADLVVLCSSDAEYPALAREVCSAAHVPVLVAGNPKAQIEELQAAGVQGFIHLQSNAVETLTEWQNRLGMKE